jgi:hypothetical protein
MTGHWSGNGQGLSTEVISLLVSRREWPRLETMYLGDVVRKCWTGEITSATGLLSAFCAAITDTGVVIGNGDEIVGRSLEILAI